MGRLLSIAGDFPVKDYSQIRDSLKTGDVFAFQGQDELDWMIQLAEGQPFNHVGMVYRDGDNLYFWDAPGGGQQFPDPLTHTTHAGCRVAPLDHLTAGPGQKGVLDYYMSEEVALYSRQLVTPLTDEQLGALDIFFHVADGTPFPGQDVKLPDEFGLGVGLALSFFIGNAFKATIAGNFFCAHLIAETYMRMGMLPIAPFPANAYSPADFMSTDQEQLPLIAPNALTDVVQVTYDIGAPLVQAVPSGSR
jgi:hypothetical protein